MDHLNFSNMGLDVGQPLAGLLAQPNYYEILNVDHNASRLMIREAYLRLKNVYTNGGDGLYGVAGEADLARHLDELETAFEVLNDDTRRADYDRKLVGAISAGKSAGWNLEAESWAPANTPLTVSNEVIQTSRSTLKVTRTHASGSHNKDLQEHLALVMEEGDIGDGAILVRLREVAGVTQQEIQERTKISLEYIRGMENNRFDRLPQVVYVKGFMRSYLRYLNVPNLEKIVSAYAARLEAWQAGQK
jgi:hypothetical protein